MMEDRTLPMGSLRHTSDPRIAIDTDLGEIVLEMWYRDDEPCHVTVSCGEADEVDIDVGHLGDIADALVAISTIPRVIGPDEP